jgi:cation transporter-like permease
MIGIGIFEIIILLVVLLFGLAGLGVLFAVVYFAVRAGTRRGNDPDRTSEH